MGVSLLEWLRESSGFFLLFGGWGLFLVSFAESSFFPVPPDVILIPLALLNPRLALWYAFVCTSASVLGGLFGYFIGARAGRPVLDRFVSRARMRQVEDLFARYGGWAVGIAGFTPIPYKIFTIAAGIFRVGKTVFVVASLIGRGTRFFLEAVIVVALGKEALAFLGRNFEIVTLVLTLLVLGVWFLRKRIRTLRRSGDLAGRLLKRVEVVYRRRFQPLGAYGIQLLTGFGLAGFFLVIFSKLAEDLVNRELDQFDSLVIGLVKALAGPEMDVVMKGFTFLGSAVFLIPAALVVAGALYFGRRHTMESATVLLTLAGGWVLDEILKAAFRRPRPEGLRMVPVSGWSFPSGHSMVAFAFYGLLGYLLWVNLRGKKRRIAGVAGALLLAVLIGISRIYLGVHYPSDVVAGFAAGGFWATACVLGLETLRYHRTHRAGER